MYSRLNTDSDGYTFWHIHDHGRDTLWRHMNEAQKVAVSLMEKWGWTLIQVYRDRRRECVMYKTGEMNTIIYRS